jgi:uncharacterized membrane protein
MQKASLRHWYDRLRHTLLFEAFGLLLASPLAALLLNTPVWHTGALVLWISLLAMLWNLLFNWGFDWLEHHWGGHASRRSWRIRWLHAALFELSLTGLSIPMVMIWMQLDFWPALAVDLSFIGFYLVYTLLFNRAYDHFFPLPEPVQAPHSSIPQE